MSAGGEGSEGQQAGRQKVAKKAEYERLLNELFGTSIKWSKLSMEELVQLVTVLTNPDTAERIASRLRPSTEARIGIRVDEGLMKSIKDILSRVDYDGPIVNTLRKLLNVDRSGQGS